MASDHSTAPASPGLTSQVATLTEDMGALVAVLDPDTLGGADAAALYGALAKLERLVVAAKTLLAPRIATSGHWEVTGHRSAAELLAGLEGGSPGQARRTLVTGQRLGDLPGIADALRRGELSGAKAAELADVATLDPDLESELLHGAEHEPLRATRERCQRARATSARNDPLAAARRIHAGRHFRHWTDAEGAFCFQGRDTPERGAALLGRLVPTADRIRDARRELAGERDRARAEGTWPGSCPGSGPDPGQDADLPHECDAALWADALFALVTDSTTTVTVQPSKGTGSTGTGSTGAGSTGAGSKGAGSKGTGSKGTGSTGAGSTGAGSTGAGSTGATTTTTTTDAPGEGDVLGLRRIITRPPPATIIVRVDLAVLRRGTVGPGDLCDLDGFGPIPLPLVHSLAADARLDLVFVEAGDIRAVSHRGRTVTARLRTALVYRDRTCVVPGCAMPYGLEIHHLVPYALGGPTELDNLALLCRHHHRMQTDQGWELRRHGPSDEDPQWSFTPLPPFGQEPDLGLDRPRADAGGDGGGGGDGGDGGDGTLFDGLPEIVVRR